MTDGDRPPTADERARHARLSELVANRLELDAGARGAYLLEACGADEPLRQEVESILAGELDQETGLDALSSVIGSEAVAFVSALAPTDGGGPAADDGPGREADGLGDRVPGYEPLEEPGAGGFGTVWLARQLHPVQRDVALKVLKPGMDTREILPRFRREQQTLARMSHDNVARVLDAGMTAAGRPSFAMEVARLVLLHESLAVESSAADTAPHRQDTSAE